MENFLSFIKKIIDLEPIAISDLLTFTTSIILLIITLKSVTNAKRSNEITLEALKTSKEALELQKKEFNEAIKPTLVIDLPYGVIDGHERFDIVERFGPGNAKKVYGDYHFNIENRSNNIAYNVNTYVYLYADNESWKEYKEYFNPGFEVLFQHRNLSHLDSDKSLENSISTYYFKDEVKDFRPQVYILLSYENKVGDIYEEAYVLTDKRYSTTSIINTLNFTQEKISVSELKEKVSKQHTFFKKYFNIVLSNYKDFKS